ncbi:MAG: hypothetical protein ACI814_004878 [Mariniblastus sp.]|jgi:hypothetical protein
MPTRSGHSFGRLFIDKVQVECVTEGGKEFPPSSSELVCIMKRFLNDLSGSVTIEFVLWVPMIFFFMLLATDASLAFMRQSQMWQVSRETARVVSRYGMDEAAAESFAASGAKFGSYTTSVDVSFVSGDVIVTMAVPSRALAPFGTLGFLMNEKISTRVTHAMEPL